MATSIPLLKFSGRKNNGQALVGGKLYTYRAGTNIALDTYTTPAGDIENSNPIILDSRGEANVYLGINSYKFVLYDALDNLQYEVDNIANGGVDASLQTVSTLSDLRGLPGGSSNNVYVASYASISDGGEGFFSWAPLADYADDDGICITPSSEPSTGRWLRQFSGAVNVRWFGCNGSGPNDYSALLNAIGSAINFSYDDIVMPDGYYTLNSSVTFPVSKNLEIQGYLDGSGTVNILGGFFATDKEIFASSLNVRFGNRKVPDVKAVWFASISKAFESLGDYYGKVSLSKSLTLTSDLIVPRNITFEPTPGSLIGGSYSFIVSGGFVHGPNHVFTSAVNVRFERGSNTEIYIEWWRDSEFPDDSFACNAASRSISGIGSKIQLLGKYYTVSNWDVYGETTIQGVGSSTIINQKYSSSTNYGLSVNRGSGGTSNPEDNQKNLVFRDFKMVGTVVTDGFREHAHLMNFNAVSNVLIENVIFEGFRGDGIYLGTTNVGALERHNQDIVIRNCFFDGVNHNNRNAISVIDGNGVLIEGCTFKNTTRSDMPGAIDLEPDSDSFAVIKNIRINNNKFSNIYGSINGAVIQVFLPLAQSELDTPSSNIIISNNQIDCYSTSGRSNGIAIRQRQSVTDSTYPNNIIIENNQVSRSRRPFYHMGIKNILSQGNTWIDSSYDPSLGIEISNATQRNMMDINFINDHFENLGNLNVGAGVEIYSVQRIGFNSCTFVDIGLSAGGGSNIKFDVSGATSNVSIIGNTFTGTRANPAIAKDGTHSFSQNTFLLHSNKFVNGSTVDPKAFGSISNTSILVGDSFPTYILGGNPYWGINLYYDGGDTYGKGSSASYGAAFTFVPSSGLLTYKYTPGTGNEGTSAATTDGFTISRFGTLHLGPNSTDPQIVIGSSAVRLRTAAVTPNGSSTAEPGSIVFERNGSTSATPWFKKTGSGNTGWIALLPLASANTTLVAGSVTVSNALISANTIIRYWRTTAGGTLGHLSYTLNVGVGFTINSSSGTDTSVIRYEIVSY